MKVRLLSYPSRLLSLPSPTSWEAVTDPQAKMPFFPMDDAGGAQKAIPK